MLTIRNSQDLRDRWHLSTQPRVRRWWNRQRV
jgi:hypothetical protein